MDAGSWRQRFFSLVAKHPCRASSRWTFSLASIATRTYRPLHSTSGYSEVWQHQRSLLDLPRASSLRELRSGGSVTTSVGPRVNQMSVLPSPKTKYRESRRWDFGACFTLAPGSDSSGGLDIPDRVLLVIGYSQKQLLKAAL